MPYLPMTAFQKIMGDYMKNEKAKQFLRFLSVAGNFKLKTNAFLLSCFIVPALMLFSNIVMAQVTEEWVARYNGSGMFDGANAIAVDANGNVYVTGYSYGSGTSSDYATIKYDTNGNELWTARYNGLGNGYDYAAAIEVDASGNVYVTGYSVGSGTSSDYATIKYDTDGKQLWVSRYNGPGNGYDYAFAIAVDANGNVYVTGGSPGSGTSSDYATIKYDTNGNELWLARYNSPGNSYDQAAAIAVDANGNVYVTGYSYGSGTSSDYATIKYDTNGNQLWVARYDGRDNSYDLATDIAVDASGNVYVTGGSYDSVTSNDYATIKYDTNGNQLWLARYNGPGNFSDSASAIAIDAGGNVYVTGISAGSYIYLNEDYAYATIKYDTNGNELWVARYNYNSAVTSDDIATAIAVDANGNVYVTGRVGANDGEYYFLYDYATIKYVQGMPDLIIQSIETNPSIPVPGENIVVTVTVKNQGDAPVIGDFWIDFYKHLTSAPHPYQTGDFYCSNAGLAAGATDICVGNVAYETVGVFQMWAQVDTDQHVAESIESNNVFGPQTITVPVPAYTTLTVAKAGVGSGTVTSTPTGINCGTDCTENYNYGTMVTLTPIPDMGSIFTGWSGACTGTGSCTVAMDATKSVTAAFDLLQITEGWTARYNGPGNSYDQAAAIAVDASGNVYVTGYSYDSVTSYDYATIKYDTNGNELWVAGYNGPGNSYDYAAAIAVDATGNVYVTGNSDGGSGTSYDYATIKYDTNGNELWVARYNGPGNSYDQAAAIAVDASGNVYVTGYSYSGTSFDYATIKYDANGNELWLARYNGPGNSSDQAAAIAVDASGNVYVTGYSSGSGTADDYATIKYDTDGNELWVSRYNGPGNSYDQAAAIAVDASGNVYVTGNSDGGSGTYYDYATIKYDANGNELWLARYNDPGNNYDAATAIAVDASGNVYVTGNSYSGTLPYKPDYATIKYDTNGNELWVARYNGPGNRDDYAFAIAVDANGNVYVTGYSDGGSGTSYDYATIKYDANGNQLWLDRYNGTGNSSDTAKAIAVDASGNVYVTGYSDGGSGTSYDYATIKITNNILTITKTGTGSGTVTSNPGGINCGVTCSNEFASSQIVILTATPSVDSIFAGWSGDADCSDGVVTMNASKTCTATFTLSQYTLTVSKAGTGSGTVTSSPAGINCGTDCTEPYNYGTVVTLTAAASTGSTFGGWSGACTGTGTCTVTMDAAKSVTATFNLTLPNVSVILVPDSTSIPRGGTLGYTVTGTNNTTSSQTFQYWTYVTLPNGNRYPPSGELFGPVTVTLTPGQTKSAHLTHGIPATAPLGTYTYYGNVGPYPAMWDSDSFTFTVTTTATLGTRKGWELLENGLTK